MWPYITAMIFVVFLIWGIVYYARKESANTARLKALKREIKERERAQAVIDNVRNMDDSDVRNRLRQLSKK